MEENFPYIHGFNREEQARLLSQARFAEHSIYRNIDFTDAKNLLEVGCGVGAQTEILLRRFPGLEKVVGIDKNDRQLETCRKYLEEIPYTKGRYSIQKMDAANMSFESHSFDGAFLCWVLEHIPDPIQVLSEVRRVVIPQGRIVVNEVINSSFFLEPYSPNVWQFWMAFNDYQLEIGGDPFVGLKLGNFLLSQGMRDIETNIITWHFDNRWPDKRDRYIKEFSSILLSSADQLLKANCISEKVIEEARNELLQVSKDPNAVYCISFMQATAKIN